MTLRPRSLVLVLGVLLAAGGCASGTPQPVITPTLAVTPTDRTHLVQPVGITSAGDALWVAAAGDGAVWRVDPSRREAAARVPVGETPLRVAYDGKLIWVSVFGAGKVIAIDPATRQAVHTVALTGQPEGLVAGFGAIWVVRQEARQLTRVSPDGHVGKSYPLGEEPRLVTVSDHYVFASNFGAGTITRLDPSSGALQTSAKLCEGPQGLAVTPDALWVTCTAGGQLLAVDPEQLTVRATLAMPDEPDAVHVVEGTVWVAEAKGPALVRIGGTPTAPTVANRYTVDINPGLADRANVDFAVVGGEFWVTAPQVGVVYRKSITGT